MQEHELRIETEHGSNPTTVILRSGAAEIFGALSSPKMLTNHVFHPLSRVSVHCVSLQGLRLPLGSG